MGESRSRTGATIAAHPWCIFCGGSKAATSREHTPPRTLFAGRQWPEGFEFPACANCNGGTSNDDKLAAMMAFMSPRPEDSEAIAGQGMKLVQAMLRHDPSKVSDMLGIDPAERQRVAAELGMAPAPGQSLDDLPIVRVTGDMDAAVRSLARKPTKALYWTETGAILPAGAGILFHWFTNADHMRNGSIPALMHFNKFATRDVPMRRNGKDLADQFALRVGLSEGGTVMLLMATFRMAFGFVVVAYSTTGAAESTLESVKAATGRERGPFSLL